MALSIQDSTSQGLINQLGRNHYVLGKTFQQLASGMRVSSAADNAALLNIATRFTSEVRGLNQVVRNVNDGISLTQVADAGLSEVETGLQRLRELSVQSASDTLTDDQRSVLQTEASQIQSQIDDTLTNTRFNDRQLLSGGGSVDLQTGTQAGNRTTIDLADLTASLTAVDLSTQAGAQSALSAIDANLAEVSRSRSEFGAAGSGLTSSLSRITSGAVAAQGAQSGMIDTDYGQISAESTSALIRLQAGLAVKNQSSNLTSQLLQSLLG
ncbi:MAG: flagellin FliC [Magnetococcales bacterium]|nr:flagellin FliC [Magnetococcales bacterium]